MTRRWKAAAATALAGLALACSGPTSEVRESPSGQAASPQAGANGPADPAQAAVRELPDVAGRITGVSRNELRVQPASGGEVRLKLDPATTMIELDGREATLNDLAPGTEVRASYEELRGDRYAITVRAKTGAK
jgi:hypothetical protein